MTSGTTGSSDTSITFSTQDVRDPPSLTRPYERMLTPRTRGDRPRSPLRPDPNPTLLKTTPFGDV